MSTSQNFFLEQTLTKEVRWYWDHMEVTCSESKPLYSVDGASSAKISKGVCGVLLQTRNVLQRTTKQSCQVPTFRIGEKARRDVLRHDAKEVATLWKRARINWQTKRCSRSRWERGDTWARNLLDPFRWMLRSAQGSGSCHHPAVFHSSAQALQIFLDAGGSQKPCWRK